MLELYASEYHRWNLDFDSDFCLHFQVLTSQISSWQPLCACL